MSCKRFYTSGGQGLCLADAPGPLLGGREFFVNLLGWGREAFGLNTETQRHGERFVLMSDGEKQAMPVKQLRRACSIIDRSITPCLRVSVVI